MHTKDAGTVGEFLRESSETMSNAPEMAKI
jgi:hypothetical protein